MKEIAVVSGKGGTGKTSIVGCFASLAENKVLADCDVDAADLYIILDPIIRKRVDFRGRKVARIETEKCVQCGVCEELCRFDAISSNDGRPGYLIDPVLCDGCGVCSHFCPQDAIEFGEEVNGEWYVSDTRHGPLVHARLGIAQENTGKLVTIVRSQARQLAEEQGLELVILDGPPGIGCPVIASITGTDMVLAVTEPSQSGQHDLSRLCELTSHFRIPTLVSINKWDLSRKMSSSIEEWCSERGLPVVGRIPYDSDFTKAQVAKRTLIEHSDGTAAEAVRHIWHEIAERLSMARARLKT
jgi:MinD superfamily P-loop ATPase